MLNFLDKYKLIKGKSAIGVELIFNTKDSYTIIVVELIFNKEGVEISRRFTDITLEKLAKENIKKLPVYITVGGKGVIHKKVKINEHTTEQDLLNQVLPNASLKEFYIQQSNISVNESWVSIIRKDVLDSLILKVENVNLFAVQLYLGPFILENCIPLITNDSLLTTTHELIIESNNIIQMDSMGSVAGGDEYDIEGEVINSHELIAFGTALSHFVPINKLISIRSDKVKNTQSEYLHKNKYIAVGFGLIVLFFMLTISNMLVNNSLESKSNELQYQINSKKKFVEELAVLKTELATKEQFIQNSGVTKASRISFYADQIALTVPKSIQLNQLFINPLTNKRIGKAEDIQFNYSLIKISGEVSRSIELNSWIKELKHYEWIKDINIISFIQDNLKTPGEFEILIHINS